MLKWTYFWLVILLAVSAQGRELLGQLSVSDLYLEPSFELREPKQGGFGLGNSYAAFQWLYDSTLSAHFAVSGESWINKPLYYGTESDGTAVAEAYVQADTDYGRFRMGMIPLCFGLENGMTEAELIFPRSLIFSERFVGIHDMGLSYYISNNGFYNEMIVHNGEGGSDLDGEMWFSAKWGWQNDTWNMGASGTTGRTSPQSTNPNNTYTTPTTTGFDFTQQAKIRIANLFVQRSTERWQLAAEGDVGQIDQGGIDNYLQGGHVDARYSFASIPWDLLARYDVWQENWTTQSDNNVDYVAGIAYHTTYRNSVLSIYGVKAIRAGIPDSHQIKIVWKMTPSF